MLRYCLTLSILLFLPVQGGFAAGGLLCQNSGPAGSDRLESLFEQLKREANPNAGGRLAARIAAEWSQSGSATIDLLVGSAEEAAAGGKNEAALDLLDSAIVLAPHHVGGWSQRAIVHFSMNRYDKAMADIACTLAIEPRHFPAWSEMALIYQEMGLEQQALDAWLQVLDIYPSNREAQRSVESLAEELARRPL